MQLSFLLQSVDVHEIHGDTTMPIDVISRDSRTKMVNGLYIAIVGMQYDGHLFVEEAINNGAVAVVCNTLPETIHNHITYIVVHDTAYAIGLIADAFYDFPSEKITLIGVTGTNGKTTTATLLHDVLVNIGYVAGLISTVENRIATKTFTATRTTPDAIVLRSLLADMVHAGCTHVAMEVSSHALHQGRVHGLQFSVGIFTNVTHDHLDYHETMDAYRAVKKTFFDMLGASAYAIINNNDPHGQSMVTDTRAKKIFFSLQDVQIQQKSITGSTFVYQNHTFSVSLAGQFNISNSVGVIACLHALGFSYADIVKGLQNARGPKGRFQVLVRPDGITGVVDYAHTPDGVHNILTAVQALKTAAQKMIVVIGCGGDRDTTKRSTMLATALTCADIVIATSDNPRFEDPHSIIHDMEKGNILPSESYKVIIDRDQAIKSAVLYAQPHDIVVLLGKGHETYQEIKNEKYPFSDADVFLAAQK